MDNLGDKIRDKLFYSTFCIIFVAKKLSLKFRFKLHMSGGFASFC